MEQMESSLSSRGPGFNWIDKLPADAREALLAAATTKTYGHGVILLNQSDRAERMFQIVTGKIRMYLLTGGGEEFLVYTYGPGDILGDSSVIDPDPYPVGIATRGKTIVRSWSLATVDRLRADHPEITTGIIHNLSRRLRVFLQRIKDLASLPLPAVIAGQLLLLVEATGRPRLEVSQADLAAMIGVTRQSANQALGVLRDLDLISYAYGTIDVHDMLALQRYYARYT